MRYLSVCSGIEAATVAWHHMGWKPVGFSEIEKFPSQVLDHHYPEVPKLGDMTKYKEWNIEHPDLLVGGTPCQSFSVAGLRKGMDDPRGNLALVYLGIADHFRPKWIVWENVPGVLSSNGGRDFGSFLGALAQLGYGFAYRVLDAQFFGVAQRRRRVFVVGYLGDWRPSAAVLFERKSLRRDTAPSREKGQDTSLCLTTGSSQRYDAESKTMIPIAFHATQDPISGSVSPALGSNMYAGVAHMTSAYGIPGNWIGRKPDNGGNSVEPMHDVSPCLTKTDRHGVAQPIPIDSMNHLGRGDDHSLGGFEPGAPSYTLTKGHHHAVATSMAVHRLTPVHCVDMGGNKGLNGGGILREFSQPLGTNEPHAICAGMAVRRLTPIECERLQGFPDNYTNIRDNCPDGPRYKALGNSMAVPVMKWIGERIEAHPHT